MFSLSGKLWMKPNRRSNGRSALSERRRSLPSRGSRRHREYVKFSVRAFACYFRSIGIKIDMAMKVDHLIPAALMYAPNSLIPRPTTAL